MSDTHAQTDRQTDKHTPVHGGRGGEVAYIPSFDIPLRPEGDVLLYGKPEEVGKSRGLQSLTGRSIDFAHFLRIWPIY